MEFVITPSPHAELDLSRYDPEQFANFRAVFEGSELPIRFLARPPEEASTAVVIENKSERDVTALRYRWTHTFADGRVKSRSSTSDSYNAQHRPVLKPQDRKLITGSVAVDESFLEHIRSGGGGIGMGSGMSSRDDLTTATALRFEVDMLLFADGELAGPDVGRYAAELNCRKRAAEFVAKHIRLAETEGRDASPVLRALAEEIHMRDDVLGRWTHRFASDALRFMDHTEMWQGHIRRMENLPSLPKFYRSGDGREDK